MLVFLCLNFVKKNMYLFDFAFICALINIYK
ncbi:hypothetical protein DENIT_20315 [Pseudomonas veronii]|nr:hypothetical protein DENIT_20315 [Pseudomonas veronii]